MNGKYESELIDCREELSKIKNWIDNNKLESNVKYLVCYAIVKSCGTIENVFKTMLFDHLISNANTEAVNYFNNNILNSSTNPKTGQIQRILQDINARWNDDFLLKIKSSNQKGQLNSLVGLRNAFSHGNSITTSIDEVITQFEAGCWILEKLHDTINIT